MACLDAELATAPLRRIIDHILAVYHEPLRSLLPRIDIGAHTVARVHGGTGGPHAEVLDQFLALRMDLEMHMMKEEQILFPIILSGQGSMAGGPIQVMETEHDTALEALDELSRLTGRYRPPPEACATWSALWRDLATLDRELRAHIALENEVLHPRALAG